MFTVVHAAFGYLTPLSSKEIRGKRRVPILQRTQKPLLKILVTKIVFSILGLNITTKKTDHVYKQGSFCRTLPTATH